MNKIAQTFFTYGQTNFLTGLELYFSKKGTLPVIGDIREVTLGFISNRSLKNSSFVLNSSDITQPTTENSLVATNVVFSSLVKLEANKTYALVLSTMDSDNQVLVGEVGSSTFSGDTFTPRPNILDLKVMTGSQWVTINNKKLSFRFKKAIFDISENGTGILNLRKPDNLDTLPNNPFLFLENSNIIKVYHPTHGFIPGISRVTISITKGQPSLAGIPISEFNKEHDIEAVEIDHYYIRVSSTASISGYFGTGIIKASRDYLIDSIRPSILTDTPPRTGIDWSFVGNQGATPGNQDQYGDPITEDINNDSKTDLVFPVVLNNDYKPRIEFEMRSNDANSSPIIDLSNPAITTIANKVQSGSAEQIIRKVILYTSGDQIELDSVIGITVGMRVLGPYISAGTTVTEIDGAVVTLSNPYLSSPISNSAVVITNDYYTSFDSFGYSQFITKQITTETVSNLLRVQFEYMRPTVETLIKVFIKTSSDTDINLDNLPWLELTQPNQFQSVGRDTFLPIRYDHYGDFQKFAVLVRLQSRNSSVSPTFKNFSAIAAR